MHILGEVCKDYMMCVIPQHIGCAGCQLSSIKLDIEETYVV
jgi:hypothetical protein